MELVLDSIISLLHPCVNKSSVFPKFLIELEKRVSVKSMNYLPVSENLHFTITILLIFCIFHPECEVHLWKMFLKVHIIHIWPYLIVFSKYNVFYRLFFNSVTFWFQIKKIYTVFENGGNFS